MLLDNGPDRRSALLAVAGIGALATLEGWKKGEAGEEDIPAPEDMMREHGGRFTASAPPPSPK